VLKRPRTGRLVIKCHGKYVEHEPGLQLYIKLYKLAIEYTVHLGERKVMNPNPKRKIILRGLKAIEWQDPLTK
jgi:hypothetical protein